MVINIMESGKMEKKTEGVPMNLERETFMKVIGYQELDMEKEGNLNN